MIRKLLSYIAVFLAAVFIWQHSFAKDPKRLKVHSVIYDGNTAFSSRRLEGLMLTRPSRFLAACRFFPEIFADDIENLVAFYKQNGYLEAKIIDTLVHADSASNTVDIKIIIDEGALTRVEGITIFGNEFFSDSILRSYVRLSKGGPLKRSLIEDAVIALLSLYAENGFLDASVTPQVQISPDAHLAVADFAIRENARAHIAKIAVKGNDKTEQHVITRELSFKPGDTVQYSQLVRSQHRLYLTGLFESAFVRPVASESGEPGEKDILIEIKEKPSSELAFKIGYGSIQKIRGRIELTTFNLAGTARKAGVATEANFIKQSVSASFSEPWTFGTRWRTDLNLFAALSQEPGYDLKSIGGKSTLGRKFSSFTTASLSYRFENSELSHIDVSAAIQELDPRIRSLTLSIAHDTRDNLFDPIRGWFASWANEVAGSFLHGSNTFVRSVLMVKHFRSVGGESVLGSAVEIGWMETFGDEEEIPLNERFYAGGPTSLRGFSYQSAGPIDRNGEPLGGQLKLVWNVAEIRHPIYRLLGGVLFVEAGNVWAMAKDFKLHDLRLDAGIGLRVNSPIGLVRLDCGVNLDRRPVESRTEIFLGIGQAF